MRLLFKFSRLPFDLKLLVLESLFWMLVTIAGLKFSNYNKTRAFLALFTRKKFEEASPLNFSSIEKIIWAVSVVSIRFPGRPCLRNAMTAKIMLLNRRIQVEVRIGIAKEKDGSISGHAWLERKGRIILGGQNSISCFTPILGDSLMKRFCAHVY